MKKAILTFTLCMIILYSYAKNSEKDILKQEIEKTLVDYDNASRNSSGWRNQRNLSDKLSNQFDTYIPLVNTLSELSWCYHNAPYKQHFDMIVAKSIQIVKTDTSVNFTSIDTVLNEYFEVFNGLDILFLVEKQISLTCTESQSCRTYKNICNISDYYPEVNFTNQKQLVYNIWKKYYPDIEKIKKTVEKNNRDSEMASIWLLAVKDEFGDDFYSPIKTNLLLLLRWIELTDSYEELMSIWKKTDSGSDVEKAALKKLDTFVRKK